MDAGVSGPSLYPLHRCKTIHLIRHGQGYHNVAGDIERKAYESWDFFDASLTPLGWQQVGALRNHVKASGIADRVELVVSSPLTRTLQTATGVFGGADSTSDDVEILLMVDGVGQAKHKAISRIGAPPFIAIEWCRESMGLHPCDRRQPISSYKSLFPGVNFTEVATNEDTLWNPDTREPDNDIFERGRKLSQWLLSREEKEIAVVSHSSFLLHFLALFGDDCTAEVQKEIRHGYENCEMRSVILADRRATGNMSIPTDFVC